MRFGYSLAFPLHDGCWFQKILVPACWLLVPVLGPILALGWGCEVCRRAIARQAEELPDSNVRRDFSDGLRILGMLLLYSIPFAAAAGIGGLLMLPNFVSEKDAAPGAVAGWMCAVECVVLLIALAELLLASAAIGRYASGESASAALRPLGSIRLIRAAPAAHLLLLLACFPIALLALSGSAVCLIGALFTGVYAAASVFHLIGQAHLAAVSRRPPPEAAPAR